MYNKIKVIKRWVKKSSKLKEISEIFKEINIDFNKLENKGINDMITIIRRQNDERNNQM